MTRDAVAVRAKRLRRTLTAPFAVLASLGVIFVLLIIFVPTLDGPQTWIRIHEERSAVTIRTLNDLERAYARSNPQKGFSCELSALRTASANYLPESLWTTGTMNRYQFYLVNCRADSTGTVLHYQVIAMPVDPGKSGVKAFCSDETGVTRYDKDGSVTNCFGKGTTIN